MRTGRERLIEWIEDIMFGAQLKTPETAEEWSDHIMEDINMGIIAKEDA